MLRAMRIRDTAVEVSHMRGSILARFVITSPNENTIRFEQSFSDDGGKTWELNWVAVDTRVTEAPVKAH